MTIVTAVVQLVKSTRGSLSRSSILAAFEGSLRRSPTRADYALLLSPLYLNVMTDRRPP